MVITDGTNRTGGSGLRRERDLRRQGKPPTPLPIFTESERLHRIAARASTLRDRRTLRLDRLALNRLVVQLTSEVGSILHEVHGLGWSPVSWMPLVFPSPTRCWTAFVPTTVAPLSTRSWTASVPTSPLAPA